MQSRHPHLIHLRYLNLGIKFLIEGENVIFKKKIAF